jgi:hypothetical protein
LEVGAEGGFKLNLRQDPDPGKQKLKGAVRTETYRCHYCQQKNRVSRKLLLASAWVKALEMMISVIVGTYFKERANRIC